MIVRAPVALQETGAGQSPGIRVLEHGPATEWNLEYRVWVV